jgi:hypothetical protein
MQRKMQVSKHGFCRNLTLGERGEVRFLRVATEKCRNEVSLWPASNAGNSDLLVGAEARGGTLSFPA